MLADTGNKEIDLRALPRFQRAAQNASLLAKLIIACVLLVALALTIVWRGYFPQWHAVLMSFTAMMLLVGAILQSVWWITRWRVSVITGALAVSESSLAISNAHNFKIGDIQKPVFLRWFLPAFSAIYLVVNKITRSILHRAATIILLLLTVFVLWLFSSNGNWQTIPSENYASNENSLSFNTGASNQPIKLLLAIILLVVAFAQLVIERHCSSNHQRELPEAPHIIFILRVAITVNLLLCGNVLLASESRPWVVQAPRWLAILPALIAAEILLRLGLSVFSPPQSYELNGTATLATERKSHTESFIAALWQWPIQPFKQFQDDLKQRFGVDLRQSWAFAFIRRALLPVTSSLLGLAWLLSGLTEIPIDARGIYERFGKPLAVWQPGIHLGLPWPLGRVQFVENGVVHELTAASASDDEIAESTDKETIYPQAAIDEEIATAEGLPPASANRLWDASHVAEKSQIIASEVDTVDGQRQSFHIVNLDVRLMYRIALTDEAALMARYNSDNVPLLIRSTANRILVNYFASRTLESVLGETRTAMAKDIGELLQADLNSLQSGVEIMATIVEAIHPPAAAANAYHAVQAAQINAQSIIAREMGVAAEQVNLAQLRAGMSVDKANALARETMATAEAAERRFAAENDAYGIGGKAFLFEQYLGHLSAGLQTSELVLVDHRLPGANTTLDLRDISARATTPLALGR